MATKGDPLIDEIRKIRHEISAECGHDTRRFFEHALAYERKLRATGKYRFADSPKRAPRKRKTAACK